MDNNTLNGLMPVGQPAVVVTASRPATKIAQGKADLSPKVEINYSPEEVRRNLQVAVGMLNEQMQRSSQRISFQIDDQSKRAIVIVRNTQTGEVVRQIPSEETVRLAQSIKDMQLKGLIFNNTL